MTAVVPDLDHFRARLVADAIAEASRGYWLRRADDFEDARPHVGDFTGLADPWTVQAADERCAATARACRRRALVDRLHTLTDHDLEQLRNSR